MGGVMKHSGFELDGFMMLFRQVCASASSVCGLSVLLLHREQLYSVYYDSQRLSTLMILSQESKVYQTKWLQ